VIDAYLGGRLAMMVSAPSAIRRVQTDAPEVYAQTGIFLCLPDRPASMTVAGCFTLRFRKESAQADAGNR
jgi:hypothetical protein